MNLEPQPPPLGFNNSTERRIGEPEALPNPDPGLRPGPPGQERIPDNGLRRNTPQGPAGRRWASFGNAISRRLWPLDGEKLCAQARRRVGSEDFGNPPIEPALSILANSLEHEAQLHSLGRFLIRAHLRGLLQTRLRLAEAWNRQRETLAATPIQRPVFITGMPRSGSTFLHELLAEDPGNRVPRVWELMFPVPPRGAGQSGRDWRVRKAEASLWWFRRLAPRADSVHPIRAWSPHECVAIHSYTLLSEEFISTCHIPSYEKFLHATDLVPVYAWQRRFLQYLQMPERATQWVLKAPDHVRGLDALFKAFPDAVVVQTHRDPLAVLKSLTQLIEVLHGVFSTPGDRNQIGLREARMLAEGMERSIEFRENHPELADRFIDVNYSELVPDPLPVVRRIYQRLEIPFTDLAAGRMRDFALNRSRYADQSTRPTLADWGLDPTEEARRFERYCSRFHIPCKPVWRP
jgi:hypothetical protein